MTDCSRAYIMIINERRTTRMTPPLPSVSIPPLPSIWFSISILYNCMSCLQSTSLFSFPSVCFSRDKWKKTKTKTISPFSLLPVIPCVNRWMCMINFLAGCDKIRYDFRTKAFWVKTYFYKYYILLICSCLCALRLASPSLSIVLLYHVYKLYVCTNDEYPLRHYFRFFRTVAAPWLVLSLPATNGFLLPP
jgi:fumarate reductase subunit C